MPTASEIIKLVTEHEAATQSLRDRMESDYGLYLLDRRLPPEADDEVEDSNEGFRIYTSNEPRTYADKITSWLSSSIMIIRTPPQDDFREEREAGDIAERFLIGCFEAADDRLMNMLKPGLQDTASWQIPVRGWATARVLIRKDKEDKSFIDIMPWDPLHTFWGMGSDGLKWACYRTEKTKADIKAQYGKTERFFSGENDEDTFMVYDYWDTVSNTIVVEGNRTAKKATKHGDSEVPVVIVAVPLAPPVDSTDRDDDDSRYGESVFAANRDLYEFHNLIMSVMLELVARARKPPLVVRSQDGTKTLAEDPHRAGSVISARIEESVETMGLLETTRDTGAFLGIVAGEVQRGSLPHSIFGELQFQLSGFAISTLRQGIESVVQPRFKALRNFYRLVAVRLRTQYTSGAFENLRLTGIDRQKKFFDQEIEPDMVEQGGIPRIEFKSQLPEDDTAKMAVAQMAREGPVPLVSDEWIRENYLALQDADLIDDQVKMQLAERGLPEAQLYVLMQASENRGRHDLAQFYYSQLIQVMFQKMMMGFMPQQVAGAPGANGSAPPEAGGSAGPTLPPQALPEAGFGANPPAPTPQSGPNVPPGSPRPGASPLEDRLAAIDLVLGR